MHVRLAKLSVGNGEADGGRASEKRGKGKSGRGSIKNNNKFWVHAAASRIYRVARFPRCWESVQ